jgi:hypothetical protein
VSPAVTISEKLVNDAKIISTVDNRTIPEQIEHWALIGKCAEENPDLPYTLIKEMLIGIEELAEGQGSEYKFD